MDWIDRIKQERDVGTNRSLLQSQHEAVNARYPGLTLQRCTECDEPTGRCEDDTITCSCGAGPLCPQCLRDNHEAIEKRIAACESSLESDETE